MERSWSLHICQEGQGFTGTQKAKIEPQIFNFHKPIKVFLIPAVVCYAADRNELRSRVIQWLQTEVVPDGWFVKGSNFSDILLKYFKVGVVTRPGCEKSHLAHTILTILTLFFLPIFYFKLYVSALVSFKRPVCWSLCISGFIWQTPQASQLTAIAQFPEVPCHFIAWQKAKASSVRWPALFIYLVFHIMRICFGFWKCSYCQSLIANLFLAHLTSTYFFKLLIKGSSSSITTR